MPKTKKEFIKLLANRMETNEEEASRWLEATLDSLYETFKRGEGVTLTGFGGFYVNKRGRTWAFKFNPGQKLRALFGWASTYKAEK
jgi:nucleoid DNA-binding protein